MIRRPTLTSSGTGRVDLASGPGWYPDPWLDGYFRYWDGIGWTVHTHPYGPPAEPPPIADLYDDAPAQSRLDFVRRHPLVTASVASFLIGLLIAAVVVNQRDTTRRASSTPPPATIAPNPAPRTPTLPVDPNAAALAGLVVRQADVPAGVRVQLIPAGNTVDQPTLDLCNGTFPSESLRTARLQVAAVDDQGNMALSTEAVLYRSTAATAQAFAELAKVAAGCPTSPVISPVGEPTVTTRFRARPDGAWPPVAGVDRLAYDIDSTDDAGQTQHSVAVYLRRGRALMGLYFDQPDGTQVAVNGQTSIASIVNVFAARLAQLPATVVNP
ncbi:MAG: hypothetical protein JWO37_1722 [Acidimicrobiales bacterium]|nr:hypothetical protein [Acidimicrobiales bacterium]